MIVLSMFDKSTVMVKPWAEAGYKCLCVDIQHDKEPVTEGNITKVGKNILEFIPPRTKYAAVFAFPPCTHLAVSGAAWFKGKGLKALADSVELFWKSAEICEWADAPYLIENPVSTMSTY